MTTPPQVRSWAGSLAPLQAWKCRAKVTGKRGRLLALLWAPAAGNAIGQTLDEQAADLRRDLNNNQVNVTNTGSELIVTMPQDILFALDSAAVRSDLRRDLGVVAGNITGLSKNSTISIEGHTDNTGTANYNRILSQRRANAVADILVNNGVPPARFIRGGPRRG